MEFEFDPAKSASNQAKHGLDFEAAKALWHDAWRVEAPIRSEGEPRHLVIGRIDDRIWAAIITYRNQRVRLISVRRARQDEVRRYEDQ
jgi:uncharacterized DUF497 family protein